MCPQTVSNLILVLKQDQSTFLHSQKAVPLGKKKKNKCFNKGRGQEGERGEGRKRRKNVKRSEWKMHSLEE